MRRNSKRPVDPAKLVKNYVSLIFTEARCAAIVGCGEERRVGFRETWVWEELPSQANGYYHIRVICSGTTRFSAGQACYEGPYGTWLIDLTPQLGPPTTPEEMLLPCVRVWGRAVCKESSDMWHETKEERRKRLHVLFERDPDAVSRPYVKATSWKPLS